MSAFFSVVKPEDFADVQRVEVTEDDGDIRIVFPKRGKGRPTRERRERYNQLVRGFAGAMEKIQWTMEFKVGSRSWCYKLEEYGLLKSDFDYAENLMNDMRKMGILPVDFMAEDEDRLWHWGVDYKDDYSPETKATIILNSVEIGIDDAMNELRALRSGNFDFSYKPFGFWDEQEYFVQMLVEKKDLRTLFEPICNKYHIPIANAKGWSSINQRYRMIERFKGYEAEGKQGVLLYCGDFDPKGLVISDTLRKNLNDLEAATEWRADNLIIDRFGLNYDFIIENNLTWIDNLETGGKDKEKKRPLDDPQHPDHNKDYVQDYIKKYGVRKCEANALITRPKQGRELCRQAINKYIDDSIFEDQAERRQESEDEVRKIIKEKLAEGYLDDLFEEYLK
jgi:hypothetical protein